MNAESRLKFSAPAGLAVLRTTALAATALAVMAFASAAWPAGASAHALLRSSTPASGAVLGEAPGGVTLTFTEAPDLRLTAVKVLDSGGGDHVTGPLESIADPAYTVQAPLGPLGDGVYTVSWRAVSAVDGHVSAGSFAFGVGVAPPSATTSKAGDTGAGVSESGSPPAIFVRWLLYLGFIALVGAAFVAVAVARRPAPDLLAMAAVGWVLVAAGTIGVVAVQWAETGAPIETLPSTSVGIAALGRVVSLALAGLSLAILAVSKGAAAGRAWLGVLAAGSLVVFVDVLTGHAAAGPGGPTQIGVQSIHGLAAAAWVGGLAGLLIVLRSTPGQERLPMARRFSTWAGGALVAVAMTGLFRAIDEVGSFGAFLTTDFGRIVLLKTGLLAVLAGLGAINRYVNLPSPTRFDRFFRRIGGGEIVAAVAIIALSALLVNLTPPASAGGPPQPVARPVVAVGNDFGTSLRLRLVATPGTAGANQFDAAIVDYDTGQPVDASAVGLRFELQSQAGVEAATLDLQKTSLGHFSGSSSAMSIDGIWQVTATVAVAGGSVDVPLVVATTIPPQPVTNNVSPGLPTISTVALGAAGSAQLYLDPGRPGTNDVHVTFFDAAGGALAVDKVTMSLTDASGAGVLLTPRTLDVGHFVASTDVRAGTVAVDVVGPLPQTAGGGQVHVHVTIEVQP